MIGLIVGWLIWRLIIRVGLVVRVGLIVRVGLVGIGLIVGIGLVIGVGLGRGLHVDLMGRLLGRRSKNLILSLPPAVADTGKDNDSCQADEAGDDDANNGCSGEGAAVIVVAIRGESGTVSPVVTAVVVARAGVAIGRHPLNN